MPRAAIALDAAILLMEVGWLSVAGALVTALLGAEANPVPLWVGVVVAALGFLSTRFFSPGTMPIAGARALTVGLGFLVLYLAVVLLPGVNLDLAWPLHLLDGWDTARHMVLGGLLVLAFWWSGSRVGQSDAPTQTLNLSFRIGIVVVVLGAIAHVALQDVRIGATAAVFLFFGAGIAAFALGHIISMAPQESAGLRDWPRIAALTVGGILVGSVALAFIAEGRIGAVAVGIIRLASRLFVPVVALIAWLIGLFVATVTYAILSFVSLFRKNTEPVRFNLTQPNFSRVRPEEGVNSLVPSWLLEVLGWTVAVLVAAGLTFVLWRSLVVRSRARTSSTDEEREQVEAESLGEDLAAALGSLLQRLPFRRAAPSSPFEGLDPHDPRSAALGAYYTLLASAEERGLTRQPWQTPQEFERDLAAVYPTEDVDFLTEVFQRARYGFQPPTEDEAVRLRAAMAAIQGKSS